MDRTRKACRLISGFIPWLVLLALGGSPPAIAGRTATLYVSAADGNDAWSGRQPEPNAHTADGPVATIERAKALVRALDKRGLDRVLVLFRDGTHRPVSPIRMAAVTGSRSIRDGVYRLASPVMLGPADSGSAETEIAYQAYPGEHPVFSGGVRVRGWTLLGGNRWQVTLPMGTQPFENLFYNGVRRLRPRLDGYVGPFNRIAATTPVTKDDPAWIAANCQNYVKIAPECFDRFTYNTSAPDPTYAPTILDPASWTNLVPYAPNPCQQNPGNPNVAGEIEILVFEQFSSSKLRVSCVDTARQIIYMTGPTAVPGEANAQEAGFVTGNRIIVENLESELKQPGQWYLDMSHGQPFTLTYLAQPGEDPNADEVIIPQAAQLFIAAGVQHITLRGLTFEHDNYVIPKIGHPSSELEIDVTSAISFQNANEITIDGVTVRHTAGGGLDFITCFASLSPLWCNAAGTTAGTARSVVLNSTFFDLGAHGIRIGQNAVGGLEQVYNDTNSPHDFLVWNNVVEGYGRVIPAAFGIGQGVGHDNLLANNDVYDGYHCAISISHGGDDTIPVTGLGNANDTIAFNRVYDLLQGIMNDGGSLRIEAGNQTGTSLGNRILGNVVHDTSDASIIDNKKLVPYIARPGYGGNGIYMDNSTGGVDVFDNLVYRVSDTAVYSPHGPATAGVPNRIHNNILAYARKAMIGVNDPYQTQSSPNYAPNLVFVVSSNIMYFDKDNNSPTAFFVDKNCTFPGETDTSPPTLLPFTSFENFSSNLYWSTIHQQAFATDPGGFQVQTVDYNSLQKPIDPCGAKAEGITTALYGLSQWMTQFGEDKGSIVRQPFPSPPAYPSDDYALPGGVPAIGFVPFDPRLAGRIPGMLQPPPVPPTFPTSPYDPAADF